MHALKKKKEKFKTSGCWLEAVDAMLHFKNQL